MDENKNQITDETKLPEPIASILEQPKKQGLKPFLLSRVMITTGVALVLIASASAYTMHTKDTKVVQQASSNTSDTAVTSPKEPDRTPVPAPTKTDVPTAPAVPATATPKTTPKPVPTPAPTVTPPAPVVKPVNTSSCLSENPSIYVQQMAVMTNSQYLHTNGYSDTAKMLAALQFAGYMDAINAKQVIVLTPNDWVFDNKLTAKQLAWMNADPANMRSVLGWHIVTECITYDGVNPIKGFAGTKTVNTLNGPITYTSGGTGKFENAPIAMWDWFTTNGAITFMTDFIKPPQVP